VRRYCCSYVYTVLTSVSRTPHIPRLPRMSSPIPKSSLPADRYHPDKVLKHPEYKVLSKDDPTLNDPKVNIACSYNAEREMHMLRKPMPEIEPDEVLLHVRATGICGQVDPYPSNEPTLTAARTFTSGRRGGSATTS
jgi:hypothetical protein